MSNNKKERNERNRKIAILIIALFSFLFISFVVIYNANVNEVSIDENAIVTKNATIPSGEEIEGNETIRIVDWNLTNAQEFVHHTRLWFDFQNNLNESMKIGLFINNTNVLKGEKFNGYILLKPFENRTINVFPLSSDLVKNNGSIEAEVIVEISINGTIEVIETRTVSCLLSNGTFIKVSGVAERERGGSSRTSSAPVVPPVSVLNRVVVIVDNATPKVRDTVNFTALGYDLDNISMPVIVNWSSNNSDVMSVTATSNNSSIGYANATGMVIITATSGNVTGNVSMNISSAPVVPVFTSLEIVTSKTTFEVGELNSFLAYAKDQFGENYTDNGSVVAIGWNTNNSTVYDIQFNSGVGLAVTPGVVIITASSGNITANVTVTVVAESSKVDHIGVSPANQDLWLGNHSTYTAIAYNQTGEIISATFNWSGGDNKIVTVNNSTGELEAIGIGTTWVAATAENGVVGFTYVTVVPVPSRLDSLIIEPNNATIENGSSAQLVVRGEDQYGNFSETGNLTWNLSNNTVGWIKFTNSTTINSVSYTH